MNRTKRLNLDLAWDNFAKVAKEARLDQGTVDITRTAFIAAALALERDISGLENKHGANLSRANDRISDALNALQEELQVILARAGKRLQPVAVTEAIH